MKTDLTKLTEIYCKNLKMDNEMLMMLHSNLAVRLSNQIKGTPLWLINVCPSGKGKSEIVMALDDKVNTYLLHELTSNSLVSGFEKYKKVGTKYTKVNCDLAPQLNNKTIIIPDMAQILKLHPNEKAKVWAQLRELYDGRASKKTGNMEKIKSYEDLHISLLACSTPAIDSQILIHQDLGTRELLFRTEIEESEIKENEPTLTDKVWENEEHEEIMRTELKAYTQDFIKDKLIKKIEISKEIKKEIEGYVEVLRHLRASAEIDSFSGEIINVVYPEQPTRALKQLKRFYLSLKSLDDNYPDELALQIIRHIVKSSCNYNRWLILSALIGLCPQGEKVSVGDLSQKMKMGIKTIYRELNVLWNLGIVDRILTYKEYYGKKQEVQYWTWKDTDLVKQIRKIFENPYSLGNKSLYSFSIRTFFLMKEEKKNNIDMSPSCQAVNNYSPESNSANKEAEEEELTEEDKEALEDFSNES